MIDPLLIRLAMMQGQHAHEHYLALRDIRPSRALTRFMPARRASALIVAGKEIPASTVRLLVAGVPGAGKTTVAEFLAGQLGIEHLNFEDSPRYRKPRRPARDRPSVISWGFSPHTDVAVIGDLRAEGYTLIWLDGNRPSSYAAYMNREGWRADMEVAYYGQMQLIVATRVVERLQPILVCPFTPDGTFRPVEDIAAQILLLAYGKE